MNKIRVLIVDDHPMFRNGLHALLNSIPEIEVAGEAGQGEEAITQAAALRPDVIIMDIHMPGMSGIDATRHILQANPRIGVIMVTMFEDDVSVFAAMRAGARGYLLKNADQEEILRALRAVGAGEALFGPAIAQRMMNYFAALQPEPASQRFPELTERELEILNLVAQGLDNPAISEKIGLSLKTVQNHVSTIFGKLQVADRAQAMLQAQSAGLGRQ